MGEPQGERDDKADTPFEHDATSVPDSFNPRIVFRLEAVYGAIITKGTTKLNPKTQRFTPENLR